MILKILHFFFGHRWSEWISQVFDEGYYDEAHWQERDCPCGAHEERED